MHRTAQSDSSGIKACCQPRMQEGLRIVIGTYRGLESTLPASGQMPKTSSS
jgi:hypothetical protein